MKRQDPTQIKLLHKKFHFLHKNDIKVIYDFCEEDFNKTEKILTIAKDSRNPNNIIKTLLQRPEKGQLLLSSFEKRYDEQYGSLKNSETSKTETDTNASFNFFKYIPKDALLSISVYLDPYSMANFSMTCSKMSKTYLSEIFQQYFKILCINLFNKCEAKLPEPCRFLQAKNYIFRQGNEFGPNTRHAVTNNLRKYIWQQQPIPQKRQISYLQSFGSYRNLYFKLPRVHFNGLYVCKHQYRKQQQKNLLTNTAQVHYVNYYRYFRFFEDGSVMSAVFPTKQKLSYIAEIMSVAVLDTEAGKVDKAVMIGEFIQESRNIQAKLFKEGAVFTYKLEIVAEQTQRTSPICNTLLVKLYAIKVLDQKQIVQTLQEYKGKNPIYFKYCHVPAVERENSKLIKSSSL